MDDLEFRRDDELAWYLFVYRRRVFSRHVLSNKEQQFLDRILQQANDREMYFKKGHEFLRARIGSNPKSKSLQDLYERIPYPKEELKPPENLRISVPVYLFLFVDNGLNSGASIPINLC